MSNHFDIVIVGAGPVGACLTAALSTSSLRIAVLEANPLVTEMPLDQDTRALALNYGSVKILSSLGIWEKLSEEATPINTVHISDRGHFGKTRIHARDEKVPALGFVVPATLLSTTLNKNVLTLKHLELINPAKVTHLETTAQGWQLHLNTAEGSQIITADLVIAADGTRSTIRQLAGIGIIEKDYQQSALTTTVTLANNHENIAYERFIPHGALAMLPLKNSQCGSVWSGNSEEIKKLSELTDAEYLQQLQEKFGFLLGRFVKIGKRHVHPLKMVFAEQQTKPGLILIGNAAHTLHPIAAQGFNLGLADAAALSNTINKSVISGKKLNDPQILNDYTANRKTKINWTMKFTHALTRLFSQDFLPLTFTRNTSLLALDFIPFLKHRIAKRLMGK